MNIKLIQVGKTDIDWVKQGCSIYEERLKHYTRFNNIIISNVKNASTLSQNQLKEKEGELILAEIKESDLVVLLDELGKEYNSVAWSKYLEANQNKGLQQICFVIGGAFGFSEKVYKRANDKIALSKMTFSHQMIRIFFIEQLYRGFTILKGEKYHH